MDTFSQNTEGASALSVRDANVLRVLNDAPRTVGQLERALLSRFPTQEAESWDRTGLLVGDPAEPITGIAIALDPTIDAVRQAAAFGANVLLTHHPAFITPPEHLGPLGRGGYASGAVVWEAVRSAVALMNFHTALDVSDDAARTLPRLLHLDFQSIVDEVYPLTHHGYGQLCAVRSDDAPFTLRRLAARATSVFGKQPRVWGEPEARIETVVTCTGSQGDLAKRCIASGYDALVCGEIRYHDALDAAEAGLLIVEVGHDMSELPLRAVLAAAVEATGFAANNIRIIDQGTPWMIPEAVRK